MRRLEEEEVKAVVVVDSEDAVAAAIAMAIRWFFILFGVMIMAG